MKEFNSTILFSDLDLDHYKLEETKGWLYILQSKAFPGFIKLGRTTDLKKRLASYNSNSPFNHVEILALSECFSNAKLVERKILDYMYIYILHLVHLG